MGKKLQIKHEMNAISHRKNVICCDSSKAVKQCAVGSHNRVVIKASAVVYNKFTSC